MEKNTPYGPHGVFHKTANGQTNFVKQEGVLEIYLYAEPDAPLAVVAWRYPAALESKLNLDKWTPLLTGCVSVKP